MPTLEEVASRFQQQNPGIALAVAKLTPSGVETRYVGCDPSSRFEIGSITKVFTAILLAQAVEQGLCQLDDPLENWLPAPKFFGRPITLRHLATHTSGLPRLPLSMFREARTNQPYAKWSRPRLLKALSKTVLFRPPGSTYAYSNFGFAVLGAALESIYKRDYKDLVEELTAKLGCPGIHPPHPGDEALAARGQQVEPWQMAAFTPAGALTATLDDLIIFAKTTLSPIRPKPLTESMEQKGSYSNVQPLAIGLPKTLIWSVCAAVAGQADVKVLAIWSVGLAAMATGYLGGGLATLAWIAVCFNAHHNVWWPLGFGIFTTLLLVASKGKSRMQSLGLGWHIAGEQGREVYWHNGGTAGFRSYLGISPETQTAVIALAAHNKGVDALAVSLFNP